jgi:glycerophosphoryl diester phosphodiesterase
MGGDIKVKGKRKKSGNARAGAFAVGTLGLGAALLVACEFARQEATPSFASLATRSVMENREPIQIVGHRGAKGIAPENTTASFQAAMDAGVDTIELDVHLSKDDHLVVIHDPALERTTDGQGLVSDFTLEELKALNAAARFQGSHPCGVQRIPTLQEVYDLVGSLVEINIEVKMAADGSRYPGIEKKVVDTVQRNGAVSRTIVSSFDFVTVREVQRLEPDLACYAIISTGYFWKMGLTGQRAEAVVSDLVENGFTQVAVNKQYLSADLMSLLDQAGFVVGVWIVDDAAELWEFVEMGVDRVTTDRPDLLVPIYRAGMPEAAP